MLSHSAQAESLKVLVSSSNAPPFVIDSSPAAYNGLVYDVTGQLAILLAMSLEYIHLPRPRIEAWLLDGQADLWCFIGKEWVTKAEQLVWSEPLFYTHELLIRLASTPAVRETTDLLGKNIGTSRGFVYPDLAPLFDASLATRDDAISLKQNFERLLLGRVDYIVADHLSFEYFKKEQGIVTMFEQVAAQKLNDQQDAIYCAINPQNEQRRLLIQEGFAQLLREGKMESLLLRYQLN